MAIYHFTAKCVSRGKGQNAVASAAYRSAQVLTDDATGDVKRYSARKARVVFTGIFGPSEAPEWARDRERLWNEVERVENRRNSTLAREYEAALPAELSDVQRLWLIQDFVRAVFVRNQLMVDVAIHDPDRGADARNVHVHFLFPERRIDANGFAAKKDRGLQKRELLYTVRKRWADLVNAHLTRHGYANVRVDHRCLKAQGVDRKPTIHLGHAATQIERGGKASRRGERLRQIEFENAKRYKGEIHEQQDRHTFGTRSVDEKNSRAFSPAGARAGRRPDHVAGDGTHRAHHVHSVSDRSNRSYAHGRGRDHGIHRARLRFAIYLAFGALAEARRAAAEAAECVRSVEVPIVPQRVDIWGVGQLPSPPR
jgi:hypothetical protein